MNIKRKEFWYVGYQELEDLIKETYGYDFNIPCDLETSNDVAEIVSITGYQDEFDEAAVAKFAESGRGSWITYSLLQDMGRRGIIPKGEYVINLC